MIYFLPFTYKLIANTIRWHCFREKKSEIKLISFVLKYRTLWLREINIFPQTEEGGDLFSSKSSENYDFEKKSFFAQTKWGWLGKN